MTFFMYPYLRQESVFPVLHTSYLVDVHYLPCFETSCRAMKIFKIYKIAKNLAQFWATFFPKTIAMEFKKSGHAVPCGHYSMLHLYDKMLVIGDCDTDMKTCCCT